MTRSSSLLLLASLLGCTGAEVAPTAPEGGTCLVEHVGDGDSLTCQGRRRIRLLLIDAPEFAQGEAGRQAHRALSALAPRGVELKLELDAQPEDTYGRTLAYAYLQDGRMLNEQLALQGMVVSLTYPPNVRHVERIRRAVETARQERRGLWAVDGFRCLPRDHRAGRCGKESTRR